MATFQGVIFHEVGISGWTYAVYLNASDGPAALANLDSLNTAILKVLPVPVFAPAIRVSDVTVKGDGFVQVPTNVHGTLAAADASALYSTDVAARVALRTIDGKHRVNHYLRGLRDSDVVNNADGSTSPNPIWAALADTIAMISAFKTITVNWQKRSIPPVTATLDVGGLAPFCSTRRSGRPFGLHRGRRRVV